MNWPSKSTVITGIVSLILGIGIGMAPSDRPKPETSGNRLTSAQCQQATISADAVIAVQTEALAISSESMRAIARFDVKAVESATSRLSALQPRAEDAMKAYKIDRDKCRKGTSL